MNSIDDVVEEVIQRRMSDDKMLSEKFRCLVESIKTEAVLQQIVSEKYRGQAPDKLRREVWCKDAEEEIIHALKEFRDLLIKYKIKFVI